MAAVGVNVKGLNIRGGTNRHDL